MRGFTLIELLLVLTITITLTMMSWGYSQHWLVRRYNQQSVQQIFQLLNQAKSHALAHQENVYFCPSLNGKTCSPHINHQDFIVFTQDKVIWHQPQIAYRGHWHFNRDFPIKIAPHRYLATDNGSLTFTSTFTQPQVITISRAARIKLNRSAII